MSTLLFLQTLSTIHRHYPPPLNLNKWNVIVALKERRKDVRDEIVEVVKVKMDCDSITEYMRHHDKLRKLLDKDDAMRRKIAKLIGEYFQDQK